MGFIVVINDNKMLKVNFTEEKVFERAHRIWLARVSLRGLS